MTAIEEAIQLVEKYDETLTYLESKSKTKQCALIAVDKMIDMLMTMNKYMVFPQQVKYYQEVRKEIINL